jgi:Astacin (Peptidase family M12A)/Galactose oxidase, central domain
MFLQTRSAFSTRTAMLARAAMLGATLLASAAGAQPAAIAQDRPQPGATRPCTAELPYHGRSLWNPNLWPDGVVPYEFDANVTASNRTAMRAAMNALESVAAVHFVVRTGAGNHLHCQDSGGNNSQVGMVGGSQIVNIYNWDYQYIMCHELSHALGVWHEQSRPDRNDYVTINTGNIIQGLGYNFDVEDAAMQGPYDFDSIMHYDQFAFSSNGEPTITVLPPNEQWADLIGQLSHLSAGDIGGLVSRYGPPAPLYWSAPAATGPSARAAGAMVFDSFRNVGVLYGGDASGVRSSQTWEWNGTAWSQRNLANPPAARFYHAMAYDSVRHQTVMFGGSLTGALNGDTWEYNGTTWTRRMPTGSTPSPRAAHAMCYDPVRHVTVLFGGSTDVNVANDETWEWNGTVWTQRNVQTAPSPRRSHAMVYDAQRGVTVLFGGASGDGLTCYDDTWTWNGTAWTQAPPGNGPSPRAYHGMAYDAQRHSVFLFGGTNTGGGGELYYDLWERGDSGWSHMMAYGPAKRSSLMLTYDSTRQRLTLFGGSTGVPVYYNGETWTLGPPPCVAPTVVAPISQTLCPGANAVLTVGNSTGNPSYAWRKDGIFLSNVPGHITGATTRTLTLTNLRPADRGSYDCLVGGSCVNIGSPAALLGVNTADFNGDGDSGTDDDIEAFFACIAGNCCALCASADFNGDGDVATDADIEAFFRVLAGGNC